MFRERTGQEQGIRSRMLHQRFFFHKVRSLPLPQELLFQQLACTPSELITTQPLSWNKETSNAIKSSVVQGT